MEDLQKWSEDVHDKLKILQEDILKIVEDIRQEESQKSTESETETKNSTTVNAVGYSESEGEEGTTSTRNVRGLSFRSLQKKSSEMKTTEEAKADAEKPNEVVFVMDMLKSIFGD